MAAPTEALAVDPATGLASSSQVLPLPAGLYLFTVRAASTRTERPGGGLSLPAVHVGLGPGVAPGAVEFLSGPAHQGAWLFSSGDMLVARIHGSGATLVVHSLRAPGGEILSLQVERLEGRLHGAVAAVAPAGPPSQAPAPFAPAAPADGPLSLQISAHIRARGDRKFVDATWAGRAGPGLWIESFSVLPLSRLGASDIEYKGLTASGFETPWTSDDLMCGTRGQSTALIGFAVRLRGEAAARFECEYSGCFQSGTITPAVRNGAPCRSSVANDALEGIQIRIVPREAPAVAPAPRGRPAPLPARASASGPRGRPGPRPGGKPGAKAAPASQAGRQARPKAVARSSAARGAKSRTRGR